LPNPIDIDVFSPILKTIARDLLRLDRSKKYVLFGAMGATSDPRKGFKELTKALSFLENDVELLVFGSSRPKVPLGFKQTTHYFGHLHDDLTLKVLYSSADVMVVPSQQEAFGQTATEAMSCGTPVVAFRHTGLLDIVDHKKNGYLALPFDEQDLASGIDWVLCSDDLQALGNHARNKIVEQFSTGKVLSSCIDLYDRCILNCRKGLAS
jgi:glycosyltransferase involved in cell wall biosynthesis